MKTSLDVVDEIYSALKTGALKNAITGDIYKNRRVLNSDKEDVVINSLAVNNQQLQQSIANVNIHVKDIQVSSDAQNIDYQPDHKRLNELAKLAIAQLNFWGGEYYFEVQQQVIIQEENAKEHFVNIRVNYFSINL